MMGKMKQMAQESMEQGAMGIGSSLIYAPADYAPTQELVELCRVASKNGGMYISHMRNEDNLLMEALEELITISKEADIPSQIYHLKASREPNWHLLDTLIQRVEEVRGEGVLNSQQQQQQKTSKRSTKKSTNLKKSPLPTYSPLTQTEVLGWKLG